MKKVLLFLSMCLFAGILSAESIFIPYNIYGPTNSDDVSTQWQIGLSSYLPDAVASATGNNWWTPVVGETFRVVLKGTANFSGNVQLGIVDQSWWVDYWGELSDFHSSFNVVAGERFEQTFLIQIIATTKIDSFGDEVYLDDPNLVFQVTGIDAGTFPKDAIGADMDPDDDCIFNLSVFEVYYIPDTDFVLHDVQYHITSDQTVAVVGLVESVKDLTIPSEVTMNGHSYSVTEIGNLAFYECYNLESITIPNSVTEIGVRAFCGCRNLKSVTMSNSITKIGDEAFCGCSIRGPITLPSSLIECGNDVFSNYYYDYHHDQYSGDNSVEMINMSNIEIRGSGIDIVFNGGKTVIDGVFEFSDRDKKLLRYTGDKTQSVILPKDFKGEGYSIAEYVFCEITAELLNVPENAVFTYECFGYQNTFSKVIIDGTKDFSYQKIYIKSDEVTYRLLSDTEVSVHNGRSVVGNVVIPQTISAGNVFEVTKIGDWAFEDCSSLESIIIPNSVTEIGYEAFYGCSSLESITIPNSVTEIGDYAFYRCSSLRNLTIGKNVQSIGEGAFRDCPKLIYITCYPVNPPQAYSSSFSNYNGYISIPCDNKEDYEVDAVFGTFKHVDCITAEEVVIDEVDVVVEPEILEAEFILPAQENADNYSLTITNNGDTFCVLNFNGKGQLTNIDFSGSSLKSESVGYQFTVTGLSSNTDYGYRFLAKSKNTILKEYTGVFTTKNEDGTGGSFTSNNVHVNFNVTVTANNSLYGTIEGAGSYEKDATATLIAIPASGYRFVKWNDDNTENPRTVIVTADAIFVATFEKVEEQQGATEYTLTVVSSANAMGVVVGAGKYESGSVATLVAAPSKGYQFVQWNDGNTDNPRLITIESDMVLVATFEKISTAIDELESTNEIKIVDRQILVNGEAPEFVTTVLGQRIANKNLKSGIYFVQSGNKQIGVSVR